MATQEPQTTNVPPTSVSFDAVKAAFEALGLPLEDLKEVHIGQAITSTYLRRDDEGRFVAADKRFATVEYVTGVRHE